MLVVWIVTGLAALAGSVLGHYAGHAGTLAGGALGGVVGVLTSVMIVERAGWIVAAQRTGAIVGGLIGFAIAAPITVYNLRTPIVPIAICALVGVGVLLGTGAAARKS